MAPTDDSGDFADLDADGLTNWQDWRCQTCPTNALSALRVLSALPIGTNVTVIWESTAGVSYVLERSTNLTVDPPFSVLATSLTNSVIRYASLAPGGVAAGPKGCTPGVQSQRRLVREPR